MKCPYCQSIIEDDSRWCDQCGQELKFCPSCRVPRKGNSCPACGELLVSGAQFFGAGLPDGQQAAPAGQAQASPAAAPAPAPQAAPQPAPAPQASPAPRPAPGPAAAGSSPALPGLTLSGSGMRLSVREGVFGRKGGIFPELAGWAMCPEPTESSGSSPTKTAGESGTAAPPTAPSLAAPGLRGTNGTSSRPETVCA